MSSGSDKSSWFYSLAMHLTAISNAGIPLPMLPLYSPEASCALTCYKLQEKLDDVSSYGT